MRGFIEVTDKESGEKFLVNLRLVILVDRTRDGETRLCISRSEFMEVRESYEEVLKLMEEALS